MPRESPKCNDRIGLKMAGLERTAGHSETRFGRPSLTEGCIHRAPGEGETRRRDDQANGRDTPPPTADSFPVLKKCGEQDGGFLWLCDKIVDGLLCQFILSFLFK